MSLIQERRLTVNHRSPKPGLQVRFLPLLPIPEKAAGHHMPTTEAGYPTKLGGRRECRNTQCDGLLPLLRVLS